MAITRTAMIDDDGSGTTGTILNNAWKQELYTQIDTMYPSGSWTPTDGSGAGLALAITAARYWRLDKLVVIMAHLSFPATSNPNPAAISGLPVACGPASGGFYSTYTDAHTFLLTSGNTYVQPLNPTTGAVRTNAQLSGQILIFSGLYLTA